MAIGITGARGFIGAHLARRIVETNSGAVRLLVRNTENYRAPADASIVSGDLLSKSDCERFAEDLDLIYYLAHNNSPVNSDRDLPSDVLVNLIPFLNLLQAIQTVRAKPHVVYFSSGGAIYKPKPDRIPYRETDPCAPLSSYGIQKLAAEEYLRLAASKGSLTSTVLRVGNAYGALQSEFRPQGLIGVAASCIAQGRPVRVFGNSQNVRDYVHLDDISDIAARASVPRQPFSIVNVGSGTGHSVLEVLRFMEEAWGRHIDIQADQTCGNWLTDWVVLDIEKARRELGWSPAVDLRAGISRILSELPHER